MSKRVADALQDCLELIEAGASPGHVMARYPDLWDELEPRVTAAVTVRARRPSIPTDQRAALQARLAGLDANEGPGRRWPVRYRRRSLQIAGAAVAMLMLIGGLHVASADSRPGDALYPVKMGFQGLGEIVLDVVEELPGFDAGEGTSGRETGLVPLPTATSIARRSARPRATPAPRSADPSALEPGEPASTAPHDEIVLVSGTDSPTVAGVMVTPTRGVGAADAEAPIAPSRAAESAAGATASLVGPTLEPATAWPTPTEYTQVSTGAIEGTVSGPEGQPVEGASVIVQTVHSAMPDRAGSEQLKATTDSDGRYRIAGVPAGTHLVFVRVGHRTVWYPGRKDRNEAEDVTVRPGQTTTGVDIRMDQLDSGARGRQRGSSAP